MENILKNFTLLYIEDDTSTVEMMEDILSSRVKKLYIAYDGEEGLEVYKEKKPDIVLTDINMPKRNGIDMSKEIKKINPNQAIIILTAFNENRLLHQSVDIGIDGYITKPILDIEKMFEPLHKIAQRLQGLIDQENIKHLVEVQGKTAAVGEMIGNIAHQWRQPLSVISLHASNVKYSIEFEKNITKEDLINCAEDILIQTNYLSQTIDDFRNFLKADTSRKEKISLQTVIKNTASIVEVSMKDNNIESHQDIKECFVLGNENQMMQALINICNNAKDALVEHQKEKRYFFISLYQQNNKAIICIKDNGGGIEETVIDRIFEPYFTTKHPSVGTGIGLYMTFQTITKIFEGTIDAKNVEYEYKGKKLKGAQFTIRLPLS